MIVDGVFFGLFSANYCFTTREQPEGLLLLCQVALGQTHRCYHATSLSAATLPDGTKSTLGCGQTIPDPAGNETNNEISF